MWVYCMPFSSDVRLTDIYRILGLISQRNWRMWSVRLGRSRQGRMMATSTVGKWLMDSGKQIHCASAEIFLPCGLRLKTGDPISPAFYLATALLRGWKSGSAAWSQPTHVMPGHTLKSFVSQWYGLFIWQSHSFFRWRERRQQQEIQVQS